MAASPLSFLRRLRLPMDAFGLAILAMVVVASILPARGDFAAFLDVATDVGVAILFFLHGAKLSRQDILAGIGHWRLHAVVLLSTYAVFPLLVLTFLLLPERVIAPEMMYGLLFLAALPSTVQSSIAFTSVAGGNVAAAVCAASLSSLAGVVLTPLLVSVLIKMEGEIPFAAAVIKIVIQILLPFVAGHLLRPLIAPWLSKHKTILTSFDKGTIVAIVYTAFSVSVVEGLWSKLSPLTIVATALVCLVLLTAILYLTRTAARALHFSREDEITIVFCGSKKSLAAGMPMAKVLFGTSTALGAMVLPLMIFHQVQLMACAAIANRYAESGRALAPDEPQA